MDRKINALMGSIFFEGVTVNKPFPFVKWKNRPR